MSRTEYNVGYHDQQGNLRMAFTTWTWEAQARKRLAKLQKTGGVTTLVDKPGGGWDKKQVPALLVKRTISDPEVVE